MATDIVNPIANGSIAPAMLAQPFTSGTAVASTSGTSIDFTSIPSWAKRISIGFNGVSTSGIAQPLVQIGKAGGIENTGYLGVGQRIGASSSAEAAFTAGWGVNGANAAYTYHGIFDLILVESSSNTWVCRGLLTTSDSSLTFITTGSKSLAGTLDRVRITTSNGTDTFDTGKINVFWE